MFEEGFVAGDCSRAAWATICGGDFGGGEWTGEIDGASGAEELETFRGNFESAEFFGGLATEAEANDFTAERGPFGAGVFFADAVGGELVMAPFEEFF